VKSVTTSEWFHYPTWSPRAWRSPRLTVACHFSSAFKYCCRARAEKEEKKKIWYACLAKVTREGGFRIAIMARLSAIPGHCASLYISLTSAGSSTQFLSLVTTAVFATCGMNIFVFIIACIISLPKQFITVYLGVILKESEDPCTFSTLKRPADR
jgi:uncharacterized membrane protein YdjX (TVP38/TMEM64 family)